jgi:galactokinase
MVLVTGGRGGHYSSTSSPSLLLAHLGGMADKRLSLSTTFRQAFPSAGDFLVVRAPGRINLLGGHTDYNDGFVLPAAVDRYLYVAAAARGDAVVRVHSCALGEGALFRVIPDATGVPPWARAVHGVFVELAGGRGDPEGADLLLWGNLPIGSGLSSSAALEVGVAWALCRLTGREPDPVELARLGQYVEHTYVGVRCGIMDQMAVALSRQDSAMLLDCRSLDHRFVPLGSLRLVVCHSGKQRDLAASEYNRRRRECEEAVRRLRALRPNIRSLRDVAPEDLREAEKCLPPVLAKRVRHVVEENGRVVRAAAALSSGDLNHFGRLVSGSHKSLRDLYEVSCSELDALVEIADGVAGVYGCRLTGAGFGGAVVAVATEEGAADLAREVRRGYPPRTGLCPSIHVCQAPGAVRELELETAERAWGRVSDGRRQPSR